MYIALEGGEGVGKSQQQAAVAKKLRKLGHKVVETKEPGGTKVGEAIREILLNRRDLKLVPKAEVLLFSADRAQLMHDVISPALAKGMIVIADRTYLSTYVYQGTARVLPRSDLETITDFAVGTVKPDLVEFLKLDPVEGLGRKKDQGKQNKIDAESLSFHEDVLLGYLELAMQNPETWEVIDASKSLEKVTEDIMSTILKRLSMAGV